MITKQEIKKELYKVDSPFEKRMTFSKNAIETYTNLTPSSEDSASCCFRLTESTIDDSFSFICVFNNNESMIVLSEINYVLSILKSFKKVDTK